MKTPDLDDLIDQLEDAQEAGRQLSIEQLCSDCPELIEPLQRRWAALNRFDDKFCTQQESDEEVQRKLAAMPAYVTGTRIVMQTELHLDHFHDCGGLGEVYEATDESLSRKLAVKLLRADRQLPTNLEDFKREAQIIGRLNHPGIVSILGWGETFDGRPFYTMPFVDSGNLLTVSGKYHNANRARIDENDKVFRDLLYRLISVCKTIAYAHSRSIVHRDLKPENVMLGKYGETLVIDWGCATRVNRHERFKLPGEKTLYLKGLDDTSSTGGMTLRYASPEQLHGGKPVGPESDIYSLGAILYRLLTGRSPLEDVPPEQVASLSIAGKVPPPETLKAGISKPLAAVCKKAMSLQPEDRYETALALADDLERFLSDASVSVCKATVGTRMARIVRRNRTASAVLLGMLLISSALLSIALAGQSVSALKARQSAKERLRMAATMAANIGGFEIDRRLSLLEREAEDPGLVAALAAIENNPTDRMLWERAQNLLYKFRDVLTESEVELESMFLNDSRGVQVARAPLALTIGENFAYRNYFHGQAEDIDPTSAEYLAKPPGPAQELILSNAYVSTNPDKDGRYPIKTAFSVPIFATDAANKRVVIGRLGMSVAVNDLGVFDRLAGLDVDACLIETRGYQWGDGSAQGLILDRQSSSRSTHTFSVPQANSATENKLTENQVKNAMPHLSEASTRQVLKVMQSRAQAELINGFFDAQITPTTRDAASAPVRIPYRDGISTGWAVLFYESEGSDSKLSQ